MEPPAAADPRTLPLGPGPGPVSGAPDPFVGSRIWSCEIQRRLGSGGMGSVYLARHLDLDKPVAVKVMAKELLSSEDHVRRFRREAQLAAKLEHPNVVTIHHVGEQDGVQFIVMQYVDGRTLEDILAEKGRLSLGEAVSVVKRVAFALAAAHKLGIVHRDIKPANILVSREGIVKVADFGLARPGGEGNQSISATGQIVGTPSYMSPEQAQGGAVDARSDLYSLGATFYHLVTGKRCFEGNTPLSIVIKHIQEDPPEPHVVNAELPPSVSRVILKMMAKDPAKRYASAEELVKDLDLLKGSGDGTVRKTGPTAAVSAADKTLLASAPALPGAPRNPWKTWAIAAGCVVLALGLVLAFRGKPDPEPVAATTTPSPVPKATPTPKPTPKPTPAPTPTPTPAPTATPAPTPEASPVPGPARRPFTGTMKVEINPDLLERFKEDRERQEFKAIAQRFKDLAEAISRRDKKALLGFFDPRDPRVKEERVLDAVGGRFRPEQALERIEMTDLGFSKITGGRFAEMKVEIRTVARADDFAGTVTTHTWGWHEAGGTWYLRLPREK